MESKHVQQGAGKVFLQLRELELDALRLKANQQRQQSAQQQYSKEAREWYELRRQEALIDDRIRRTPTWSGKWWRLLEELDIVRKKVIAKFKELTAPKEEIPQPMGQVASVPPNLPIRTDLALSKTLDRIAK